MNCGEKRKKLYLIIFQCLIILTGYIFLCNRIRFGIDFTDEPWYVAEPYIVANGAIPYVNNWTQAPGFTLPLALLFKLYMMIAGGTEGIMLYSRILYAVVSFIVYSVSIFMIAEKTGQLGTFIAIFPLLSSFIHSLYDLNYNTLGVMYLFLGCILLFFSGMDDTERKGEAAVLAASGIIMARAIIASPYVLIAWAGALVILAIRKKWKQLLWFLAGNTAAAVMVVGWCCARGGIGAFLNGMRVFLTKFDYFQHSYHTFRDDISYVFNYCKPFWCTFIVLVALKILRKKGDAVFSDQRWYRKAVMIICMAGLFVGIAKSLFSRNYPYHYDYLIRCGWFESILLAIFLENVDKEKKNILIRLAWISGLDFAVYIFSSAANLYGFGSREYWLVIPTVLGYLSWYFVLNTKRAAVVIVFSVNLLLGALLLKSNYEYVYRDQPIINLTAKVDCGIWKGCYTTPERAENVKLLEQYIRSITDEKDNLLFRDWASFAYLMTEGKACSYTTLSAGIQEKLQAYFESVGRMPNKIIYIDYGHHERLSIDSDWGDWKLNEFVNENYELAETYDTNPEITDKYAEGQINTASFFVKFYREKDKGD